MNNEDNYNIYLNSLDLIFVILNNFDKNKKKWVSMMIVYYNKSEFSAHPIVTVYWNKEIIQSITEI